MKGLASFLKTAFILVISLMITYIQLSVTFVFTKYIGIFHARDIVAGVFVVIWMFLFCFVVPYAISKFIFREKLQDLGLALPECKKKAFFLLCMSLSLLLPCIFFFATLTPFKMYYSFGHPDFARFAFYNFMLLPIYYFAEEFFFRWFLFMGLWRKIRGHSFWITEIIFTVAHLGKPPLEILYAIPAGVVLSYLTLKTKSIYPAIMVHCSMGLFLSVLVNFSCLCS